MLAVGLLLAMQVSVNVDVNRQGASAGIGVRSPLTERIPVTDALRRTAFKDTTARDLLLRARATRLQQDSALLSYDVRSYQRVSVGMSLRETARERLAFRTESAAHVRWHRATGARVEMLGARSAAPIVAGMKDAEDDIANDQDLSDMMAIPYYPGKDELWLFEMIGNNSDDEGRAMLVHPVAEGSEAYFTFATGDSVLMTLPDGKRITLREIRVIPREARWNLVVGSFWFETERAFLVRAVMRFSAPMDVWETVEAEEPDAKKDIPLLARGLVSPMKADITAVTIEYGLLNQRFWLPRTQGAEGYARVSFMRIPLKVEQRYRYESVNGIDSLPAIPPPRFKTTSELTDSLKAAGADSTVRRDFMKAHHAMRDSVAKADRAAQCAISGSYVEYHRQYNGSLPLAIEVPCDAHKLATSSELPPSIYDEGEELFGAKERAELMQALDFALQPGWAPQALTVGFGLQYTRFNRVEGFGTGALVSTTLGKGYTASVLARGSLADAQLNGEFTLARSNGRREVRGTVYRRLAVSSDFGDPLSFGASFVTLLNARDEGFYHRTWGAELSGARPLRGGLQWRLFAEQQFNAPVENRWSLFGGANDDRYLGNVVADNGWLYGAAVRWRGSRGLDPRGWRLTGDVRLEGAAVDFAGALATSERTYGRAFFESTLSRGLGRVAASLTGAAGTTTGAVPAQRQFFLGGLQSVRGQTPGSGYGQAFWLSRLEIGSNNAAFRPVVFGDLGWAGARDGWSQVGRPMSGAGVGVSMLDGMFRFDVARGIYPRVQTRVDFSVEARF